MASSAGSASSQQASSGKAVPSSNVTEPTIDVGNPYTPRRPSPIVSVSINHPIAQAARKVKNFLTHKQTLFSTSFSIKVTPIVAIVSLFGVFAVFGGGITTAYNIGKSVGQKFLAASLSPTPSQTPVQAPVVITRTGTIKATYELLGENGTPISPKVTSAGESASSSTSGLQIQPTLPILHYILVLRNGSIVYLAGTVHMANYLNHQVVVTGTLDSAKNTLTVTKAEDIELLQ